MAERLKDLFFTKESIDHLASTVTEHCPPFDRDEFLRLVYDDIWEGLELKARMRHVSTCLHATLPPDYSEALAILEKVVPSIHGFDVMVFPDYVEQYGLEHWDRSFSALKFFTLYASGEFAIRPFLKKNPQRALAHMLTWADDQNHHVRRLASEGCRPRLPWAMALPAFKKDPGPIFPILEKLKNDPSESVRRSVANNLNDISKDHPERMLEICERWFGVTEETDQIVKHACRGLLKAGNSRALLLFGLANPAALRVEDLALDKTSLKIGDELHFSFALHVDTDQPRDVRLEYALDFVKAKGQLSRKMFQIRESRLEPGTHSIARKHAFADLSTRRHYPGRHFITIFVNGVEKASDSFLLEEVRQG